MNQLRPFSGAILVTTLGACLALSTPALAGSIAGNVQTQTNGALVGYKVDAYQQDALKLNWKKVVTATTVAGGAFTMTAPNGTYRLLARAPIGMVANRQDKWYDFANPTNNGYTLAAADDIVVSTASPNPAGNIIQMDSGYGMDGRLLATPGGAALGLKIVRAELQADYLQHHQTLSRPIIGGDGTKRGLWSIRGLQYGVTGNAATHRLIVYDPSGVYEPTLVLKDAATPGNLLTGAASFVQGVGNVNLPFFSAHPDPYEPNNNAAPSETTQVNAATLMRAGIPFVSSGAMINPGDVDWYCWSALATERYIITTSTAEWLNGSGACCTDQLDGELRYSPWVDPMIRLFKNGTTVVVEDDDSAGLGPLDARIDTQEITGNPGYCVIVTTYGDPTFAGAAGLKRTYGRYQLKIEMGNRRPNSTVSRNGNTVNSGDSVAVDESQTLSFDIASTDPDGDALTVVTYVTDSSGAPTGAGSYDPATGTWSWTPSQAAAGGYTLTVEVCDQELCDVTTVNITVNGVNVIPTVPVQVDPADGSTVVVAAPSLVLTNSFDPDPDVLTYDFQIYYFSDPGPNPSVTPDQETTLVAEGGAGQTSWVPPTNIPEDTWVWWRVRAWDGVDANSYSPWSGTFSFFVNTFNGPPNDPVLALPADGSQISIRTPTLEANNTTDPEGDAIELWYEVATDDTFSTIVTSSSVGVAQATTGATTSWIVEAPLNWGAAYAARVYAVDALGAQSGYSSPNHFSVAINQPPTDVALEIPFSSAQCNDLVLTAKPQNITITNATDPEGEPLTIDLEIFNYDDDPAIATPLFVANVLQDTAASATVVPVDDTIFAENGHYRVRARANDGIDQSAWQTCDLWYNGASSDPTGLSIISPRGDEFPAGTADVTVTVQNASDEDSALPGTSLSIAYCASADSSFADCPASPVDWNPKVPSSADPTQTTAFVMSTLTDNTPLADGMHIYVQACAMDETNLCSTPDSTDFTIAVADLCATATCAAGQSCDPATGACIGGTDGGTGDGGNGGTGTGKGCCSNATAEGGSSGMALGAFFGLLLLGGRRRRRR